MIVCETAQKPLILFHLIHAHGVRNAIIFTKSAESTTRLVQLFQFFEAKVVGVQLTMQDIYEKDDPVGRLQL